jgi:hypothetical protein
MRFFSHDAKESNDDDRTRDGEPSAVPQQRTGSPWSDGPDADAPDAEPAARERADDTDETAAEAPPFHEPSPQPTAFGASTVGGAVAASAMANPLNDTWQATDRDAAADSGVGDDRSVAPGDGAVAEDAAPEDAGPDGAVSDGAGPDAGPGGTEPTGAYRVHPDSPEARPGSTASGAATPSGDADAQNPSAADEQVDVALEDDGTFGDPQAVDPATGRPLEHGAATGPDTGLRDDGGFDDPTVVDPATEQPLADPAAGTDAGLRDDGGFDDPTVVDPAARPDRPAEDPTPADTADSVPVVATVPAPAAAQAGGSAPTDGRPGSVPEPGGERLFADADAQGFRDRWRDVQLRFVDSPKEATAEAASLVDDAVDRLTAGLRAQKDRFSGDSDDTERLRVELRGYRDLLNRVLNL